MIEQLLTICTSLLFLFVGYFFGKTHKESDVPQKTLKKIEQVKSWSRKNGILEYPTQEDIDYQESGEKKVDEAREKLFKENFKP